MPLGVRSVADPDDLAKQRIVQPLPPAGFPPLPFLPPIAFPGHGGISPIQPAVLAATAIKQKYSDLGGESGILGAATKDLTQDGSEGYHVDYKGGSIYWNSGSGAHEIHGEVYTKWISLGGPTSFGFPSTDTTTASDGIGKYNRFYVLNHPANAIHWSPETGAHSIVGFILLKWEELGSEAGYGYPITDDSSTLDGFGRFSKFQKADKSVLDIYWSPDSGAHAVYGLIKEKWENLGSEKGYGYPTTDETGTPDGLGRFNQFTGGRAIYWTPATGAHAIYGDIKLKWDSLGFERGYGYPITDETGTPDGIGRYNQFTDGRAIYWTPTTGARAIYGVIKQKWDSLGSERSFLGYPRTDEEGTGDKGGRFNDFQGGTIYWSSATGAHPGGPLQNQLVYTRDHHFDHGVPANGSTKLVLNSDGSMQFSGHMHDSGAIGFDFVVGYSLLDADKQGYVATQKGSIHGTFTFGSRDYNWNENSVNGTVKTNWRAICATPEMNINAHIAGDIGAFVGELFGFGAIVGVVAIFGGAAGGKWVVNEDGTVGRRWEWE